MQALKMFTGGGGGMGGHSAGMGSGSQGGGASQGKFVGMAMAEAGKLFDQQGGHVSSYASCPRLCVAVGLRRCREAEKRSKTQ